jgi:putative aldouronate transport system permease protein
LGSIMRGQFDLFYNIIGNNGTLYESTDIIDTFVYRTLMVNFNVGMSAATGFLQSVFGLVIVMTVNGIIRKTNKEYALF